MCPLAGDLRNATVGIDRLTSHFWLQFHSDPFQYLQSLSQRSFFELIVGRKRQSKGLQVGTEAADA